MQHLYIEKFLSFAFDTLSITLVIWMRESKFWLNNQTSLSWIRIQKKLLKIHHYYYLSKVVQIYRNPVIIIKKIHNDIHILMHHSLLNMCCAVQVDTQNEIPKFIFFNRVSPNTYSVGAEHSCYVLQIYLIIFVFFLLFRKKCTKSLNFWIFRRTLELKKFKIRKKLQTVI